MEHYFTNNENLKSEIREIEYVIQDTKLKFLSDNGVFSKNKIDYASRVLLETFLKNHKNVDKNIKVLDVGCGYGFLGITISKLLKADVELIDINKRAIHLCERNIKLNEVNAKVYESNVYENVLNKYDYIITNPPIRAGKDILYRFLKDAKNYLNVDGELWFVISKDQGAKSTKKELEKCYNVEVIEKNKGFYCFKAKIC